MPVINKLFKKALEILIFIIVTVKLIEAEWHIYASVN